MEFLIRRRWIVLVVPLVFNSEHATAGFERTALPPRLIALGFSPLFGEDVESLLLNPSAVSAVPSLCISVFHSPSPFGLPQLSNGGVVAAFPLTSFCAGLSATSTGFSLYRELTATATLGKDLGGKFFIGTNINIDHLAIAKYGTAYAIGVDLAASDRKSTRLNSSHSDRSRMPSSA